MTENFLTPFEIDNNYTPTYFEVIDYYKKLANKYGLISVQPFGETDSGFPLHEIVVSTTTNENPSSARKAGKAIFLLNNGIHPGEPCGIDASMIFVRNLVADPSMSFLLENITFVIIPFYNIGGGLNRGAFSRANQVGPKEYGFRGNAKNLDLNRDFVKCDSKNAQSFNKLFNKWNPDIFIDTHTSNGADYTYTMTLINTQKDKLGGSLGKYMDEKLLPDLYKNMEDNNWEMIPYVYARKGIPDNGILGFLDNPRYSSGFAAMHNTFSFMPEAHMLKPYKDRVWSTYAFIKCAAEHLSKHNAEIINLRISAVESQKTQEYFTIDYTLDETKIDKLNFKGYKAKYKPSLITGSDRLYYDQNEPFTKEIDFYRHYKPKTEIQRPLGYIIPQAYSEVIDRLKWNGVEVEVLKNDTAYTVEMYKIINYETAKSPYESHFPHANVSLEKKTLTKLFRKGDFLILANQNKNRYIIETLEPQAPDSYFVWNFFDGILNQKEYYSAYVFEDLAFELLEKNSDLKKIFETKKVVKPDFASNPKAQLDFIYKNSPYFEDTVNLYPVARWIRSTLKNDIESKGE